MKAVSTMTAGWEAYTQSRSEDMREKLLVQYMPLVRRVAGRMVGSLPRSVRMDDMVSAGVVGLLASLNNFDPSLGVKFETFATNRIRGAMVDALRELDWVPRSIRQKARQLERVIDELTQKQGRMPEDEEIAARLDLSFEDYQRLLDEVNVTVLLSLDDTFPGSGAAFGNLADVTADVLSASGEEAFEDNELRELTVSVLKKLPEQERLVLALYYYEELTFKEIGSVLGLTESRVSQIHSKAILKLKAGVRQNMNR
jgi:RNA polymerase sigma factor FliA